MENNYQTGSAHQEVYNVDFVFCIDATGSMDPFIKMVKRNVINFYDDVTKAMEVKGKAIDELRIRLVVFRDFLADQDEAMLTTNFFKMPESRGLFENIVNNIEAKNGGDIPEDGLEALALAIKSPWSEGGSGIKRRQVIVVWTDTWTHDLGYGAKSPHYPADMPKSFGELSEWWGVGQQFRYVDKQARRLIIFAPDKKEDGDDTAWKTIADLWDQSILSPSIAGKGLEEKKYELILSTIVNSI